MDCNCEGYRKGLSRDIGGIPVDCAQSNHSSLIVLKKVSASLSLCFLCVAVENENHCDFVKLREMLIRTNMEDLIEQTHTRHYELYRRCKLEEMGFVDLAADNKPMR